MDLLKFLIGATKFDHPCLLCFKNDKSNLDINMVSEIRNNCGVICLSLADMLQTLFPSFEFIFMQACNDCLDLISELYILLHKRKSKIFLLNTIIEQLLVKTKAISGFPVANDKLVLQIQVPVCQEQNIEFITNKDNENPNGELEYVGNKSTHLDRNAETVKICKFCSQTFLHINELKSHLKVHRKKQKRRPIYHFCNDCNYSTLSKTTLQAHINKNHLNTRPHICRICYKGFYNKSNLNEHVKTHNSQRSQVCELCGCSFIHKKSLIEHLRLHSGTRPYKCDICHRDFVTSGRRSDHIKRTHMEKTECCLICNKKYSLKKELTRHMNNVHLRTM